MENSTKNTMPTNTDNAIESTLQLLKNFMLDKTNYHISDMHMEYLKVCLNNIANAKKLDVLNQINNLK